jgi:uncharacterized sulfatase
MHPPTLDQSARFRPRVGKLDAQQLAAELVRVLILKRIKLVAPRRFFDLYDLSEIEIPNNPTDDLADMPRINSKNPTHEVLDAQTWRAIKRAQLACISYVDWCVGQMMDAIKENKLDRNTIVVLWTNHGFALGDHFQWSKGGMLIEETDKLMMIFTGLA